MLNKIILFTSLTSFALFSSFQISDTDFAKWSAVVKLSWNDYKAAYDAKEGKPANSHVLVDFTYKIDGTVLTLNVRNVLMRNASYYDPKLKSTELLLSEQTFFDIAEVAARKFKKHVATSKIPLSNANTFISAMYKSALQERTLKQIEFRKDTQYGKNKTALNKWATATKKELDELAKYQSEKVVVNLVQ